MRLRALGTVLEVRSRSAVVEDALCHVWKRCIQNDFYEFALLVETPPLGSLDATLEWLSSEVTLQAIELQAGRLWMLHATGVANTITGATIALVGPSGTGKTTAARVLGLEFGYVSDETVGIDPEGAVLPYPKPLSVVQPGQQHKQQISPDEAGLLHAPADCHIAGIVLLNRVDGADLSVRPLPTGEALVRLAEQTSYVARMERPLLTMAGHLERVGGAVEVTYSEASDLIPVVREMLGS